MTTQMPNVNHARHSRELRTRSTTFCSLTILLFATRIGHATAHSAAPEDTYQATLIATRVESQFLLISDGANIHLNIARGINSRGQIIAATNGEHGNDGDVWLLTPIKK